MTVISSKEFATKPTRYYNLALNEKVIIKRGKNIFHLTCTNGYHTNGYDTLLEPDEDLRRAITGDEVKKKMRVAIHNFFESK